MVFRKRFMFRNDENSSNIHTFNFKISSQKNLKYSNHKIKKL